MGELSLRKIIIFSALAIVILGSGLFALNWTNLNISKARKYMREYRTAKAIQILSKLDKKNSKVQFLLIHAHAKIREFEAIKPILEKVKDFPSSSSEEVLELFAHLSNNDQMELLLNSFPKCKKLKLREDFFIELSKKRNNITEELKILEAGIAYLDSIKKKSKKKKKKNSGKIRKIDDYLVDRYIDIAKIFMGNKKYKDALTYLEKANKLGSLENSSLKGDYYFQLGLAYKNLGKKDESWKYFRLSAAEGNLRAKDMVNKIKRRFVPRKILLKKKKTKEELENEIKVEVVDSEDKYL